MECMAISANNEYIIASRGSGNQRESMLPDYYATFCNAKINRCIDFTNLRQIIYAIPYLLYFMLLIELGYKRGYHYVVGRHAPKILNFKTPYINPFDYDYVIQWFNGIHPAADQLRPANVGQLYDTRLCHGF